MDTIEIAKLFVPGIAIVISVVALYYSRKSWLDSNRPIITVRVSSQGMAGNVATPLSLIVENTGNRPAIDISLTWHDNAYLDAFKVPEDEERRVKFTKTYTEGAMIPVLPNGKSVVTSFGHTGSEHWQSPPEQTPTWHSGARFKMDVNYNDIDGRKYKNTIPLIMADDQGFAGGIWNARE